MHIKNIENMLSFKHPNSKVFVISDHHFFHEKILDYERPNFDSLEQMHNTIITSHNKTVKPDDIVILLGDFSFKAREIENLLSQMNGIKYLVYGNHDYNQTLKNYLKYGLEGVFTLPVNFKDNILSHIPIEKSKDLNENIVYLEFKKNKNYINYHGHVHTHSLDSKKHINTSVEAINYTPLFIGSTTSKPNVDFVNSNGFEKILNYVVSNSSVTKELVVHDYIYSYLIHSLTEFQNFYYTYGSFPFYKKYQFASNFSDIDIGVLYQEATKGKNIAIMKKISDTSFEALNKIHKINPTFLKRTNSLSIFRSPYLSGHGITTTAVDVNLVPLNIYEETDFVLTNHSTLLNKLAKKLTLKELEDISYTLRSLTSSVELTLLILQFLFQKDYKKAKLLKSKINLLNKITTIDEATFIRYMLRQLVFLDNLNRSTELEFIQQTLSNSKQLNDSLKELPTSLINNLDFITNSKSRFVELTKEVCSSSNIITTAEDIMKLIRK